ncbi:zinc finger protein 692-like [Stegostoma tigrinum]|uniref:zinc finger protein 692-like n=1 Tax=Stegostoma tigrinum TaxID=3053191 RepID=UPI00286FF192|nr:zinc finger protein 692-like [Stegostoma tigrinum]
MTEGGTRDVSRPPVTAALRSLHRTGRPRAVTRMEDRKPSRHRASEDVRRQKRKELDARRSKSRIRLGTHLEQWCHMKDQLGFHLHSDFAKFLLDSYASKSLVSGSGADVAGDDSKVLRTSSDALRQLVVWSHDHSRECGFIPDLKSVVLERSGSSLRAVWECIAGHSYPWLLLAPPDRGCPGARTRSRSRNCERGAAIALGRGGGPVAPADPGPPPERTVKVEGAPPPLPRPAWEAGGESEPCRSELAAHGPKDGAAGQAEGPGPVPERAGGRRTRGKVSVCGRSTPEESVMLSELEPNRKHCTRRKSAEPGPAGGLDTLQLVCESDSATDDEPRPGPETAPPLPVSDAPTAGTPGRNDGELEIRDESDEAATGRTEESTDDDLSYADDLKDQNYSPSSDSSERTKRKLQPRLRGRPSKESPNNGKAPLPVEKPRKGRRVRNDQSEEPQIPMRKIRKKAPMEILRCEFEGCGKVVSNRQYLKVGSPADLAQCRQPQPLRTGITELQEASELLQQCPQCGFVGADEISPLLKPDAIMRDIIRLERDSEGIYQGVAGYGGFELEDRPGCFSLGYKRDYICEFCARQFRTTSNLIIHRRIHTGEKPLQCEICGFTCRQKASLNWHMKKHDAEAGYQFSCDICGKKFEKKDNVSAHKRKSHPETPAATVTSDCPSEPSRDWDRLEPKAEPSSHATCP